MPWHLPRSDFPTFELNPGELGGKPRPPRAIPAAFRSQTTLQRTFARHISRYTARRAASTAGTASQALRLSSAAPEHATTATDSAGSSGALKTTDKQAPRIQSRAATRASKRPMAKGKDGKQKAPAGKSKDASSSASPAAAAPAGGKLKPATAINVRHILCEKHSGKEAALEKLRAGAKFDEVARELSEDKARQGGSLGWKTRGSLLADFEKVAYRLEVSTTGNPKWGECKTGEGYHIIMVEGRK